MFSGAASTLLRFPRYAHAANVCKAKDEHCPGGAFGDGRGLRTMAEAVSFVSRSGAISTLGLGRLSFAYDIRAVAVPTAAAFL
jgi:hypothetical protein